MAPITPAQKTDDPEFHNEVIQQLLRSLDCTQHLKDSLGQFLGDITADANPKHLAYHLFCTVTLFISKQIILDDEQMSVLCRTIAQLRHEWSDDNPSSKQNTEPVSTEGDLASNDTENMCHDLQHVKINRSPTPDGFVREIKEWTSTPANFHEAVGSKDTTHLRSQYPFGYQFMIKHGWKDQRGLGPDESGIPSPLDGETLAQASRDPESSTGLGYATKTKPEATKKKNYTPTGNKKIIEDAHPATAAWHRYVEDPFAGDLAAKSSYGCDSALKRDTVVPRSPISETNGSVKIIVQDQYVITDTWKDTSHHPSNPETKKDVPQETQRSKTETTVTNPWVSARNTRKEDFNGW